MKTHVLPILLLSAIAGFVSAARTPVDFASKELARFYNQNGNLDNSVALDGAFDADDETTGVYLLDSKKGGWIEIDFTSIVTSEKPKIFVDTIEIAHDGNSRFSLYTSEDRTTWTPVSEAQNVKPQAGSTVYKPKTRALYIKYVFETASGMNLLGFKVNGWLSEEPHVVSSLALANLYSNTDENLGQGGTGGGSLFSQAFDGKFTDPGNWRPSPLLFPNVRVGYYILIDFTSVSDMPNGYFVTEIKVGHSGLFPFSLYYWSPEINDWVVVPDADHIQKKSIDPPLVFGVNATTTKIKYVFEQDTYSDYGNGHMSEIQVLGMDPDDVPCLHPGLDSIEWTTIEGTATCTEQGTAERFCPVCGERFTKQSDDPPLGHDYITTLDRPGAYKRFGSGSISCSRCDFFLPCTNVYEQASTNGPVDLAKWGGLAVENFVQFTDLTVTSSDHPQWGPVPEKIIDGNFGWANNGWCTFWASAGWNDQHVDFTFGTTIDLTKIDICVHNHEECHMMFYDVDDETGEEFLLGDFVAPYIPDEMHHEGLIEVVFSETTDTVPDTAKSYYTIKNDSDNNNAPTYFLASGLSSFSSDVTYYEKSVSAQRYYTFENAAARVQYLDKTERYMYQDNLNKFVVATKYYIANGVTQGDDLPLLVDLRTYATRTTCRFFQTPCKHLRLRMEEETGYRLWAGHSMCIVEMRPWGTVRGAGDHAYRKETLLIFR